MTNLVYVNWTERQVVVNPDKWINSRAEEIADDDDLFDEFLSERHSLASLFRLSERDKKELMEIFKNYCLEDANTEFEEKFDEYNLGMIAAEE